jgi:hypothetical protein
VRNTGRTAAARPGRRVAVCGALAGVASAVGLMATPGIAVASTAGITPFLDCVTRSSDGDRVEAVIGYRNTTGHTSSIPYGPDNHLDRRTADHRQPTTFLPGSQHGVFALQVDGNSRRLGWTLAGRHLVIDTTGSRACSAGAAPVPISRGDTDPVLGLIATGVVGAFLRRLARSPARWLRLMFSRC